MERRIQARKRVKCEVIILTAQKSFRASTLNLSTTGALLSERVPAEFMNKILDVVVIFQATGSPHKLMMKFTGKMVGGTSPTARLTFVAEAEKSFDRLSQALWNRRASA